MFGYVLSHCFDKTSCSGCNSGTNLVVALRLTRFRRSYVKRPAVVLTSSTSYTAFLLDVCSAFQSGHVPFFAAVYPQ